MHPKAVGAAALIKVRLGHRSSETVPQPISLPRGPSFLSDRDLLALQPARCVGARALGDRKRPGLTSVSPLPAGRAGFQTFYSTIKLHSGRDTVSRAILCRNRATLNLPRLHAAKIAQSTTV